VTTVVSQPGTPDEKYVGTGKHFPTTFEHGRERQDILSRRVPLVSKISWTSEVTRGPDLLKGSRLSLRVPEKSVASLSI
jgi:hypothetical protein